ncbi:MAG: replication-relaxation family protein [Pseudonocardia sp.]|nr:replication-relaxation family protein [Pseudonocardia sp.]
MTARRRGRGATGLLELGGLLSDRDQRILRDTARHRFLTTRQIEQLFFFDHASALSGARACRRVLRRLEATGLLATLPRRIGGLQAGSASSIWTLAPAGARMLSYLGGDGITARLREPSSRFVEHALAIAEVHVALRQAERAGRFAVERLQVEQEGWRSYLGPSGVTEWLKPDLAVVTATPEFEDHWFIEADLGTEHLPTVIRKCRQYESYRRTGVEQADGNVFPVVVWAATTPLRAEKLRRAIRAQRTLDQALFRVCLLSGVADALAEAGS